VNYYNENAEEFYKGTVNLNMEELYTAFLELIPMGGKILDAGCGSGRDSLNFTKKRYSVTAFDNSEKLVRFATELLGQPVLLMSFDDLVFQNEFDGIWACASLLHVPKIEMRGALSRLASALKTNGILYVSYKYGETEEVRGGRHFSNYTESSLGRLVQTLPQLTILKCWVTKDVRPKRDNEKWFNVLIRKSPHKRY
jgi:2-polyprenyl-3-methyl-5-hydroxy-6-metoxy-1,4-benzoquinol methylase